MPPEKHALLSASSASRWLKCTAAPRFEEGLPENTSEYAEEGRLAHAIGELKVLKKCTPMSTRTYNTRLNMMRPWSMTASPRRSLSWRNSWAKLNLRRRLAAL